MQCQEKTAKMSGDFDLDKWGKCGINMADGNYAPIRVPSKFINARAIKD